ncbi:MAG: glycosyl transferase [Opitutales bacterium]|nr:glycosyl transferase [Opitutales bacterium]
MKYGYFDDANREYVVTRPDTPLPWLNYIGQDDYFGLVTNTAGGYSFYKDARLRRLSRYRYNNIPFDCNGRYLYIKDGDCIWNPGWKPTQTELDRYECRHGLGYSSFSSEKRGIKCETTYFVPTGENAEIWDVHLENKTDQTKTIELYSYIEFCFYDALNDMTNFQRTYSIGEVEVRGNSIFHKTEYRERRNHYVVFASTRDIDGFETSRDTFLGMHNGLGSPKAVVDGETSNELAHGWNLIGSHQLKITLKPGEATRLAFVMGYIENEHDAKFDSEGKVNAEKAEALVKKYSDPSVIDAAFSELKDRWENILSKFQIETPSEIVNRMGNTWNQVQCMATFNLSRSASLFESGIGRGMGFRDSNQDLLGFVHMVPEKARQRVLDIAATQMSTGECFHQYQPLTKQGNHEIGGGFMDDHLWLILSTCAYIKETGDFSILEENIGYADQEEKNGSLLDHLHLSIQFTMDNLGPHDLPQIGHADWNDCLNLNCFSTEPSESFQLAFHEGDTSTAESLMIAGLFLVANKELQGLCEAMDKAEKVSELEEQYQKMLEAVETHGWDGEWYLRAFDFESKPIGSHKNDAGKIFIESQGWLLLGGAGQKGGRAKKVLESIHNHLFTENGCVLNQPPFPDYRLELGEISSYPPGYKENAGIFCHNNPWIHLALMNEGMSDRAYEYYLSICPAAKEEKIDVYRGEPYVYSQMIAGKDAATPGEAKNAWLTGTAAWAFLTVSQGFAGVRPHYQGLEVDPSVPSDWKSFRVQREFRGTQYDIEVSNPNGVNKGVQTIEVDGEKISGNCIPLQNGKATCKVKVLMGT